MCGMVGEWIRGGDVWGGLGGAWATCLPRHYSFFLHLCCKTQFLLHTHFSIVRLCRKIQDPPGSRSPSALAATANGNPAATWAPGGRGVGGSSGGGGGGSSVAGVQAGARAGHQHGGAEVWGGCCVVCGESMLTGWGEHH